MSKSIYEEALEKLDYSDEIGHIPPHVYCDIKYALKKAQKQAKLLEHYKYLSYIRFMIFSETDPVAEQCLIEKDNEILKQIKELEK